MTTWFTSDHHFGHNNIIEYTQRPFENVEEMDEVLISNWNEVVDDEDFVYHLGDFTLQRYEKFHQYVSKLKGQIIVVPGGHDYRWLADFNWQDFKGRVTIYPKLYIDYSVFPKRENFNVPITMCHYPMLSWEKSHYGAPHFHGHTHGNIGKSSLSGDTSTPPNQYKGVRIDVGVDCWNYYPVNLMELYGIVELSF